MLPQATCVAVGSCSARQRRAASLCRCLHCTLGTAAPAGVMSWGFWPCRGPAGRRGAVAALCLSPLFSFSPPPSLPSAGPRGLRPGTQPGTVPLSSGALCLRWQPPAVLCLPLGWRLRPRLVLERKAFPTQGCCRERPGWPRVSIALPRPQQAEPAGHGRGWVPLPGLTCCRVVAAPGSPWPCRGTWQRGRHPRLTGRVLSVEAAG